MPRLINKEMLPEFYGVNNVTQESYNDGTTIYHSKMHSFAEEALYTGACKLNVHEDMWGHWLYLFNDENQTVGKYAMTKRLWGFTAPQLVEQKSRLFFYKQFNQNSKAWEPWVDGTPAKVSSYKEGCGLITILKDNKWFVINKDEKIIVPPGKYDYIDGFDVCGLARVKRNGYADLRNPEESTKDRWGIINVNGEEVLPVIYDEIWAQGEISVDSPHVA